MSIAGQYLLHPGCRPSIRGGRPVVAHGHLGHLLRGQNDTTAVQMLGQLFSLCAHAHRHTARLALLAARQQSDQPCTAQATAELQRETARDHLRSMALDWPSRLDTALPPAALQWLNHCPLALASTAPSSESAPRQLTRLGEWLQQQAAQLPFLLLLARWQATAVALQPSTRTLDVLDADPQRQSQALRELAAALAQAPAFASTPQWRGACAETGVWTRLRHRGTAPAPHNAWSRMHARWTELLELCNAPEAALLSSGALYLGTGQAIAWSEMARGLLLHWVQLDGQGRVQDYRVLAPTEWNFHPGGALAQALTGLDRLDTTSARCLSAAYDPCVACSIEPLPKEQACA